MLVSEMKLETRENVVSSNVSSTTSVAKQLSSGIPIIEAKVLQLAAVAVIAWLIAEVLAFFGRHSEF